MLVREQSRVIDAQRRLIQQLAIDSDQLNAMRVREMQNRTKPAAPSAKTPSADAQQQQPTPAPKRKNRKRQESRPDPLPPQEYPASRPIPARKAV